MVSVQKNKFFVNKAGEVRILSRYDHSAKVLETLWETANYLRWQNIFISSFFCWKWYTVRQIDSTFMSILLWYYLPESSTYKSIIDNLKCPVYSPRSRLQARFHTFCYVAIVSALRKVKLFVHLLLTDETEDEDVNKEYVEETNRDAVMIAAAKLVASDTVSKVNITSFSSSSLSLQFFFLFGVWRMITCTVSTEKGRRRIEMNSCACFYTLFRERVGVIGLGLEYLSLVYCLLVFSLHIWASLLNMWQSRKYSY